MLDRDKIGALRADVESFARNATVETAALAYRAIDDFERYAVRVKPEPVVPLSILASARSRTKFLRELGIILLSDLAVGSEAARLALAELSEAPSARVRGEILGSLTANIPERFSEELISKRLPDDDSYVRQMAVGAADRLGLRSLLPTLQVRCEQERDETVKRTLLQTIDLLSRGYAIRDLGDGTAWLVVRLESGGRRSAVVPRRLVENDVSLSAEVRRLRGLG